MQAKDTSARISYNVAVPTQFLCAILNSWERGPGDWSSYSELHDALELCG